MRCSDLCIMSFRECTQEKKEGLLYSLVAFLLLGCVIVLLTLANNSGMIVDSILKGISSDGDRTFSFYLKGFAEEDIDDLSAMGFYNIFFPEKGTASGMTRSIDGIWGLKIRALFDGKDIWSSSLDEILVAQLFCELILYALSFILGVIFIFMLSNSYSMRLIVRERYICMLKSIGYYEGIVHEIIAGSFWIKNIIALFLAEMAAMVMIRAIQGFLSESAGVNLNIPVFSPVLFAVLLVLCFVSVTAVSRSRMKKEA